MTQKSYPSKTFTDFTHPMSEIVSGMCGNGIVITGLQEFDYDICGGFENRYLMKNMILSNHSEQRYRRAETGKRYQ